MNTTNIFHQKPFIEREVFLIWRGYDAPLFYWQCKTGFAGDGIACGYDSDLDGWPDDQLNCEDQGDYTHCTQVNCTSLY